MIDTSREYYQSYSRPSSHYSNSIHQARSSQHSQRLPPHTPKAYTNVYNQSASKFNYMSSKTLYNQRQTSQNSQQRPAVNPYKRHMYSNPNNKFMTHKPRGSSQNVENTSSRIRSFSKLNQTQPKSHLDTLRRQTPFQRAHSASRNFVSDVVCSRGASKETSMIEDYDNRVSGSTFINVPKVKTNYLKSYKPTTSKKSQKNPKKKGLKSKLQKMGYANSLRTNPIMRNKNIQNPKKIVNKRRKDGLRKRKLKKRPPSVEDLNKTPYLKNYSEAKKQIQFSNLFSSKKPQTKRNLQLNEDIFDRNKRDPTSLIHTPKSVVSRRGSRLENFIDSRIRGDSETRPPPSKAERINIVHEMWRKSEDQTQNTSFASTRSLPKTMVSSFNTQVYSSRNMHKVDQRNLYSNSRQAQPQTQTVNPKKIEEELNKYLQNPDKAGLVEDILAKNQVLNDLRLEYANLSMNSKVSISKKIDKKQQSVTKKQSIITQLQTELDSSGKGHLLHQRQRQISFERTLTNEQKQIRQKKITKLNRLDARCKDLGHTRDQYARGDFWMEAKKDKNLGLVYEEEKSLRKALQEDDSEGLLVEKMRQMIRTLGMIN